MDRNDSDRRAYRHKRRIRNQIVCWLVLVLMMIILGVAAYIATDLLGKALEKKGTQQPPVSAAASENTASEDEAQDAESTVITAPEPIDEIVEETEPVVDEEDEEDPEVAALLDGMSLEQKIDGLLLVSPEAITGVAVATMAGDGTKEALTQFAVGGIVYTAKNVVSGDQFKELVATTKDMYHEVYNRDLLVLIDEEGKYSAIAGKAEEADPQPSAKELAETGNRDNVTESYETIAAYLKTYGVDADMAPQAAVLTAENSYLGERIFSDDADIAASMTAAAVEGLKNGGVMSCLAAFPGEGGVSADPDNASITTDKSAEELKECEYKPFISGIEAGADMIMVSNIVAANAGSGDASCSLSEEIVTNVLRNELGFEGVVVSAPLDQVACTSSATPGAAALKAFIAGADLIYVRSTIAFNEAREALRGAVEDGTISEELVDTALKRVYTMKLK